MPKEPDLTPASFAVLLVMQRCLPLIFAPDTAAAPLPVQGQQLTADDRRIMGRGTEGTTIGYPVNGHDVFFERAAMGASVWFVNADFRDALQLLEDTLKRTFKGKELSAHDVPAPSGARTKTREYVIVPTGSRRAAVLRVTAGLSGAPATDQMFVARVFQHEQMAS